MPSLNKRLHERRARLRVPSRKPEFFPTARQVLGGILSHTPGGNHREKDRISGKYKRPSMQ